MLKIHIGGIHARFNGFSSASSPGPGLQRNENTSFNCRPCCRKSDRESHPEEHFESKNSSGHQCGLLEAARYARQDALLVTAAAQNLDERARSDLTLLARQILRLDLRARKDLALLGTTVTKLDARAREKAHKRAGRIRFMATKMKEIAGAELKLAATEHWNDGALDADLRLADLRARRRAMEDAYAALQIVKSIQSAAATVLLLKAQASDEQAERPTSRRISSILDKISEFEDEYLSLATLLADSSVLDQTDPDELEFIIATLIDMDEVEGATGASLVTETASSPDTAKRRALVDALANTPSLWALGNAGMSALQRLSKDENPEVSAAASNALTELEAQWRQIDGSMHFVSENSIEDEPDEI